MMKCFAYFVNISIDLTNPIVAFIYVFHKYYYFLNTHNFNQHETCWNMIYIFR
jgi:hypothetical protein